jgi:hypothetical protein
VEIVLVTDGTKSSWLAFMASLSCANEGLVAFLFRRHFGRAGSHILTLLVADERGKERVEEAVAVQPYNTIETIQMDGPISAFSY